MSKDNSSQDKPEFEQISPARVEITSSSQSGGAATAKSRNRRQRVLIITGLALLVAIALGVIFLLPGLVDKPVFTDAQLQQQLNENASRSTPGSQVATPWEEAQQARLRNQAQTELSGLLEKQDLLEDRQVHLWAEQAFEQNKALAKQGDQSYRQNDFAAALDFYKQAHTGMVTLLEQVETLVEQTLSEGEKALIDSDAEKSGQAFSLVLRIKPGHSQAEQGLARARAMANALSLVEQAKSREIDGQLEQARSLFKQALSLSPGLADANEGHQRTNAALVENEFGTQMSQGFNAIRQQDYAAAKTAFSSALKLKPGSGEARDGLEQAELQITRNRIQQLGQGAEQQEQSEQWQSALENYERILKLDNSLQFAQLGKQHTSTRARLDRMLTERIAHPERLSSPGVFQETQALLEVAKNVSAPGPRLASQIAEIEAQLRLAVIPVMLTLQSDNLTEVTIKKVADLGKFSRREIMLKPGSYVLVGKRLGYRDVRLDITVSPEAGGAGGKGGKMTARQPVVVQCTEKI